MSQDDHKPQYRFPKSRSKRLADALDLAAKLSGFAQDESGYSVCPNSEEVGGDEFAELLKISEKWKGSGFWVQGSEVSKEEFLKALASSEMSAEEEPEEPKEEVAELPAEEVAEEPEKAEEGPKPIAISTGSTNGPAAVAATADDEVEVVFVKPKPAPPPAPRPKPRQEEGEKKRRGFCCCCWWLPFGSAALLAIILNIF